MKARYLLALVGAGLLWVGPLAIGGNAQKQEPPKITVPDPGVPQIMSIQGRYIRAAYNNEGYAILGYKTANLSVGEPWILLEMGMTLRDGVKSQEFTREAFSLDTPDGKHIALPTTEEYRKVNLNALQQRNKVQRDAINYFPPNANKACTMQFFTDLEQRAMSWDKFELTDQRACVGRLYFPVEGGIKYGQYWLNIKFAGSMLRVPFRVLTKEEDQLLDKNYKSIKAQVDEAFKPPKK